MALTYNNRFYEAFGERENHFALQKHLMVISQKALYIDHFILYLHLMMCSQFSCQISGNTQASRYEQKIMRNLIDKKRTNVNEKIAEINLKKKMKVNETQIKRRFTSP